MSRVVTGWLGLGFNSLSSSFMAIRSSGSSCARAGIAHLQYFVFLQNFCRCDFYARADLFTLEWWRSSGFVGARAGSPFFGEVLGDENLRSSGLVFTLKRMCFAFVSWRSSGHLCARAGSDVCALRSSALFSARAGHAYMSYPLGDFKSLFTFLSLSYFF